MSDNKAPTGIWEDVHLRVCKDDLYKGPGHRCISFKGIIYYPEREPGIENAQPPKADVGCRDAFRKWCEKERIDPSTTPKGHYLHRGAYLGWCAARGLRPSIDDAAVERGARAMCIAMHLDPDRQYPAAKEWEAMAPATRACLTAALGGKGVDA